MAVGVFEELYKLEHNARPELVLDLVDVKVTEAMNNSLCRDFSEKEICDAMFQMGPLKAPGPDGFPARFYQKHWGVVKEEVVVAIRRFFHDGVMPEGINDTAFVLIPKVNEPDDLKDFRPISLCNVIYKLISKCIVNKLRGILNEIINPEQSAFVPTRRITDNALVAFECANTIQKTLGRKADFCAYKLDLSKAYDRVDWCFLRQVMERLGFHSNFMQWIMTSVTTVQYSVCLNGTDLSPFRPSRGLRQGDLLSPYLFLLVANCLSLLVKSYEKHGLMSRVRVCRRSPSISHLLFADDSVLFFKLNVVQARNVQQLLTIFERSTGQKLSPSNCSLLVHEGADPVTVQEVRQVLGVEKSGFEEKYLGLPLPAGCLKGGRFQTLEERYAKCMSN
jgi:hypothetical protein